MDIEALAKIFRLTIRLLRLINDVRAGQGEALNNRNICLRYHCLCLKIKLFSSDQMSLLDCKVEMMRRKGQPSHKKTVRPV